MANYPEFVPVKFAVARAGAVAIPFNYLYRTEELRYVLAQSGAHVLIMTHDHAEDFALCDAALRLPKPLGSIGLIGSSVKWTRFQAMLSEQGHSAETIGRITCPIGLPGITGKDPAVIAVAVASALLQMLPGNEEAAVNGEKEEKGEWAFPGK